jgi:hypothetical protein
LREDILLPEDRNVRTALREQLADHGCDAAEEMRPEAIFQAGGRWTFRHDPRGEAVGVHRLDVGMPDQVDLLGRELRDVGFPGARVGAEILGGRELGRVDEDRDDHLRRAPFRKPHEGHMAVMECTHGRHQCDGGLPGAKIIDGAAQHRDRADDQRFS